MSISCKGLIENKIETWNIEIIFASGYGDFSEFIIEVDGVFIYKFIVNRFMHDNRYILSIPDIFVSVSIDDWRLKKKNIECIKRLKLRKDFLCLAYIIPEVLNNFSNNLEEVHVKEDIIAEKFSEKYLNFLARVESDIDNIDDKELSKEFAKKYAEGIKKLMDDILDDKEG